MCVVYGKGKVPSLTIISIGHLTTIPLDRECWGVSLIHSGYGNVCTHFGILLHGLLGQAWGFVFQLTSLGPGYVYQFKITTFTKRYELKPVPDFL